MELLIVCALFAHVLFVEFHESKRLWALHDSEMASAQVKRKNMKIAESAVRDHFKLCEKGDIAWDAGKAWQLLWEWEQASRR